MKYYVSVTEMLNTVVCVEAESEKEAIDKAKYEYSDGVIELTREDNYSGEQFEIDDDQEYWRKAEESRQHSTPAHRLAKQGEQSPYQ